MESGPWEIYVRPFPDVNSGKWVVSTGGGSSPRWAHSGREIFYTSADSVMMVARVDTAGGFRVADRRALFEIPDGTFLTWSDFSFDVAPGDLDL